MRILCIMNKVSPPPLLYARRGLHGISPTEVFAENTYEAFELALRNRYDGIELDVHLTKDNELIVIHDDTLNRTSHCNKTMKVKQMNCNEIIKHKIKNGKEKYPLLDNVLKLVKSHNKRIIIDVKTKRERALRNILNMVKKMDFDTNLLIVLWWGNNSFIKKYHDKLNIYRAYKKSVLNEKIIKNIQDYYFKGVCLEYTGKENNLKTMTNIKEAGLEMNLYSQMDRKKIGISELDCEHFTV